MMHKLNSFKLQYEWGIMEGDHLRFPPAIPNGGKYDELACLSGSYKTANEADLALESQVAKGTPMPKMVLLRSVAASPRAAAP